MSSGCNLVISYNTQELLAQAPVVKNLYSLQDLNRQYSSLFFLCGAYEQKELLICYLLSVPAIEIQTELSTWEERYSDCRTVNVV